MNHETITVEFRGYTVTYHTERPIYFINELMKLAEHRSSSPTEETLAINRRPSKKTTKKEEIKENKKTGSRDFTDELIIEMYKESRKIEVTYTDVCEKFGILKDGHADTKKLSNIFYHANKRGLFKGLDKEEERIDE